MFFSQSDGKLQCRNDFSVFAISGQTIPQTCGIIRTLPKIPPKIIQTSEVAVFCGAFSGFIEKTLPFCKTANFEYLRNLPQLSESIYYDALWAE